MFDVDLSLNLSAAFGPILKESFPDASPRWRYAVAGALAEAVIERRSWFAQEVDETERLHRAINIAKAEIRQLGSDPDDIEAALVRINRAALKAREALL